MTFKSYALGGAAAVAITMLSPAYAFTFHPATQAKQNQQPGAAPAQTDDNSVTPAPTNGGGQ
jgi:hypothetical protein